MVERILSLDDLLIRLACDFLSEVLGLIGMVLDSEAITFRFFFSWLVFGKEKLAFTYFLPASDVRVVWQAHLSS